MRKPKLLLVDAAINLLLGLLLLWFSTDLILWLGIPGASHRFYPNILGAVLCGIGLALVWEYVRRPGDPVGLGLGGAVAINLCGGTVLAAWLLFGGLELPARGRILLWALALALVLISALEGMTHIRNRGDNPRNKTGPAALS
jgi:hypothetical protein